MAEAKEIFKKINKISLKDEPVVKESMVQEYIWNHFAENIE